MSNFCVKLQTSCYSCSCCYRGKTNSSPSPKTEVWTWDWSCGSVGAVPIVILSVDVIYINMTSKKCVNRFDGHPAELPEEGPNMQHLLFLPSSVPVG